MLAVVSLGEGAYFIFHDKPGANTHKQKINDGYCFCGLFSYLRVRWENNNGGLQQGSPAAIPDCVSGYSSSGAYLPLEHTPSRMLGPLMSLFKTANLFFLNNIF